MHSFKLVIKLGRFHEFPINSYQICDLLLITTQKMDAISEATGFYEQSSVLGSSAHALRDRQWHEPILEPE